MLQSRPGGWGRELSLQLKTLLSIVIGAAEVVAAVGADQLAMVAAEPVGASGAELAVVVDRLRVLKGAGCGGR